MNVECLAYAHKHDLTMCSVLVDTRGKRTRMRNGEKKTSEAIKELRQYLGLSPRLFGKPLGYSGTQIMRFENELTEPTDTVIEIICDAYGVDPRYFDGEVAIENAVQRVTKEENNRAVGKD